MFAITLLLRDRKEREEGGTITRRRLLCREFAEKLKKLR